MSNIYHVGGSQILCASMLERIILGGYSASIMWVKVGLSVHPHGRGSGLEDIRYLCGRELDLVDIQCPLHGYLLSRFLTREPDRAPVYLSVSAMIASVFSRAPYLS